MPNATLLADVSETTDIGTAQNDEPLENNICDSLKNMLTSNREYKICAQGRGSSTTITATPISAQNDSQSINQCILTITYKNSHYDSYSNTSSYIYKVVNNTRPRLIADKYYQSKPFSYSQDESTHIITRSDCISVMNSTPTLYPAYKKLRNEKLTQIGNISSPCYDNGGKIVYNVDSQNSLSGNIQHFYYQCSILLHGEK